MKESVNITSVKPEIEDEETLHQTKKDRRKIRHEKFLKSEPCCYYVTSIFLIKKIFHLICNWVYGILEKA